MKNKLIISMNCPVLNHVGIPELHTGIFARRDEFWLKHEDKDADYPIEDGNEHLHSGKYRRLFLAGGTIIEGKVDSKDNDFVYIVTYWNKYEHTIIPRNIILRSEKIEKMFDPKSEVDIAEQIDDNSKGLKKVITLLSGEQISGKVIGKSTNRVLMSVPYLGVISVPIRDVAMVSNRHVGEETPSRNTAPLNCSHMAWIISSCYWQLNEWYKKKGADDLLHLLYYDSYSGFYIGGKFDDMDTDSASLYLIFRDYNDADEYKFLHKRVPVKFDAIEELMEYYRECLGEFA